MKRAALYARVSTGGQTVENQLRELRQVAERLGWAVVKEFVDQGISGAKGRDQRPALDSMLKAVIRGEVEVVAAWSVDRLGRSLQDLVGVLNDIRARDVDLYLHQQGLDTSTPSGRAMYQMLGVFAEFERQILIERTKAGLLEHERRAALAAGRSRRRR
jgi:DNA invertase Pin-like site-specific DNA recombinase